MSSIRSTALAACLLVPTALGQATVVNVDVQNGSNTYVGQGAHSDPGNDYWNGIANSGAGLLASDGTTQTGVSVDLTSGGGFSYANANDLLADYRYVATFSSVATGDVAIRGLMAGQDYLVYVYTAGNDPEQGGIVTLNGVTGYTSGTASDQFIEGGNYVLLEARADANGEISGSWRGFESAAALNGLQIVEGALPSRVVTLAGSESPTVHSPGDALPVQVTFNEPVTLSAAGGAEILLDVEGTLVTATHVGPTSGATLSFEGPAPQVTSMTVRAVANSLRLLGGTTLVDLDLNDVSLGHGAFPLENDQISTQGLSVYPPVPGLAESPQYRFRVREIGGDWEPAFAWFTKCIDDAATVPYGYYNAWIGGWSHTYCNFEMANNVAVEIEIARLDPATGQEIPISTAVPHPRRKVRSWRVEAGRAYVRIDRPTLFAVDIDGQMDTNETPSNDLINETALHGVSVFANPFLLDKPDLNDPDVLAVDPGTIPPDDGPWTTLYFKPGVHQLFAGPRWAVGDDFRLRSGRTYYIPGDALVHGNMNNNDDTSDARDIRVYGHGTLSGERIDHPIELGVAPSERWRSRAIRVASNAKGCRVEGVTVADPAQHAVALVGGFNADRADYNYLRWSKVLSWRANGDGISPNGSSYLEDCFMRTQDDHTYVMGLGIRRIVYWTDVNGMPMRCSQLTYRNPAPNLGELLIEDIDIIYARSGFPAGTGRSIIGYPDPLPAFPGNDGSHVVFRDINVEDPLPGRKLFGWDLTTGNGAVSSMRFENIRMAAPTVDGQIDEFLGGIDAPIGGLVFENVTLAGEHFDGDEDFDLNGFAGGFVFEGMEPETMTFLDVSGYGKWHRAVDWSTGVEPARNDVVEHTAVGRTLTVDAPSYASTLRIGHPDTATMVVASGGRLTIASEISVGSADPGALRVEDGVVRIENSSSSALTVGTGVVHLDRGRLRWRGNHIADVRALHAAGALTFSGGQPAPARLTRAVEIASQGASTMYAAYNPSTDMTITWVANVQPPQLR